jgi:MFS family permease
MFLQTVQHKSAFTVGLYVILLLLGLVAAAVLSGLLITRTGRYKPYPALGAILVAGSMALIGHADRSTSPAALIVPLAIVGVGIGFFVQVCLLAGQHAAGHEHIGTATGVLDFFRSLGGAFGSASSVRSSPKRARLPPTAQRHFMPSSPGPSPSWLSPSHSPW